MYKVIVQKYGYDERILLAENHRELNDIINLSPKANYEIISVEKINADYARDYLEEIRKIIYPKNPDLIFGNRE